MPEHTLDFDLDAVLPFAQKLIPGLGYSDSMRAIGLRRDGRLVAATIYEGFSGTNIWAHLAAVPGSRWMTRTYLRACFAYPFLVCGANRISAYVAASNTAARRLDEHFGYKVEATLAGAAPDGGDMLIYTMHKHECRFIDQRKYHAGTLH